eukprot:gene20710-21399_t
MPLKLKNAIGRKSSISVQVLFTVAPIAAQAVRIPFIQRADIIMRLKNGSQKMTPIEFLYKLKQLPDETTLHFTHVGAVFEMLSPVLIRKPVEGITNTLERRLTDEAALAAWLGEPVSTIQEWRMNDSQGKTARFSLLSVCEWIYDHILPLLAQPVAQGEVLSINSTEINAYWKSSIPAMVINDSLTGFFWSLETDIVPTDYTVLEDPNTLSLQPAEMAGQDLSKICESLDDHAVFTGKVGQSHEEALHIYEKWKTTAMPEVLLQFFRSALGKDDSLAREIGAKLNSDLIRKGFNITAWLWNHLLASNANQVQKMQFTDCCETAIKYRVDINQNVDIFDLSEKSVFNGNVSHLLADTRGRNFRLEPATKYFDDYQSSLRTLFEAGLNIDKLNREKHTGRSIAANIELVDGK